MISHQQPIVKFGKTLINLAQVKYVRVFEDNSGYNVKWKLTVQFTDSQQLTWTYDDESDAYDAMSRFQALNDMFIMSEFP